MANQLIANRFRLVIRVAAILCVIPQLRREVMPRSDVLSPKICDTTSERSYRPVLMQQLLVCSGSSHCLTAIGLYACWHLCKSTNREVGIRMALVRNDRL